MVALTLAEAVGILEPPLSERQLREIIAALDLPAAGARPTGGVGRPRKTYDAEQILRLHAALLPFLKISGT